MIVISELYIQALYISTYSVDRSIKQPSNVIYLFICISAIYLSLYNAMNDKYHF